MPRYSVEISYQGQKFSGWQTQPDYMTVQESLEKALSLLNGSAVKVTGAGRTDAGVHARAQVASFWMGRPWEPHKLLLAVNAHLPDGASIVSVQRRHDNFDARRDALWREYAYFVWRGSFCYPHLIESVWWKKKDDWDRELLRQACGLLEGRHDFSAFCRQAEVPENAVRRIHFVRCFHKGHLTVFRIRGDAFLTNMVRIMVGNLDWVASGRRPLGWLQDLLKGGLRSDSSATAPATGLYFWKVGYRGD